MNVFAVLWSGLTPVSRFRGTLASIFSTLLQLAYYLGLSIISIIPFQQRVLWVSQKSADQQVCQRVRPVFIEQLRSSVSQVRLLPFFLPSAPFFIAFVFPRIQFFPFDYGWHVLLAL